MKYYNNWFTVMDLTEETENSKRGNNPGYWARQGMKNCDMLQLRMTWHTCIESVQREQRESTLCNLLITSEDGERRQSSSLICSSLVYFASVWSVIPCENHVQASVSNVEHIAAKCTWKCGYHIKSQQIRTLCTSGIIRDIVPYRNTPWCEV